MTVPSSGPPADRGLLYGDALFETVRLYGGRPFRLDAHLRRLAEGARRLGIPTPAELEERVGEVLAEWGRDDGALRILLSRGPGAGLLPPERPAPSLSVWAAHLPPAASEAPAAGLRALLRGHLNERALTAGLKSTGYLERVQALREARAAGVDEALLRNAAGRVVEGTTSNLFWATGGELRTPSERDGALPGVTRAVVLEAAVELGIPVRHVAPLPDELTACREVFLTSSLRELAPVVEIEGVAIGDGRPGDLFRLVERGFRAVVERETGA